MAKIVDNLILLKTIGKGNYGEVYLTQIKGRPEYYATKKMDRKFFQTPENFRRLAGEIEILQMIHHENIIKFCGLKKTMNHYYLLTDYCNGGSLSSNLRKYMQASRRPLQKKLFNI